MLTPKKPTGKKQAGKKPAKKRAPKDAKTKIRDAMKVTGKLEEAFASQELVLSGSEAQVLEILDQYLKKHLLEGEPYVLREILRLVHRTLPKGPQKSRVRGILCKKNANTKNVLINILGSLTRSPAELTWVKISQLLHSIARSQNIVSFESEKVIKMERVVDPTIVLREVTRPTGMELMRGQTAKLERLRGCVIEGAMTWGETQARGETQDRGNTQARGRTGWDTEDEEENPGPSRPRASTQSRKAARSQPRTSRVNKTMGKSREEAEEPDFTDSLPSMESIPGDAQLSNLSSLSYRG